MTPTMRYSLAYDPQTHLVQLSWQQPYTLAEVAPTYVAALALARRFNGTHWLVDTRLAGPHIPEVTNWLGTVFFPGLAARFAPRRVQLAVVSSAARLEQICASKELQPAVVAMQADRRTYDAAQFTSEWDARVWLQSRPA